MNLLIIEDGWLVANYIADVASAQAINVVGIAQSYVEVMELFSQTSIDFAIIDINIKGSKNGIEEKLIAAFFILKNTLKISESKPFSFSVDPNGLILREGQVLSMSQAERIVFGLLINNRQSIVSNETFYTNVWEHTDDINSL